MGTCEIKGWDITGSRDDAYSAEVTSELYRGKNVVRMWRSDEGADGFGAMYQTFKPDAYLGKRVRLAAAIRTVDVTGRAALCFRVDGPETNSSGRSLAFDNMSSRPPISGTTAWAEHSCVLDVPAEATMIFISNILSARGELFWADVRFEVVDASVPVTQVLEPRLIRDAPENLDFSQT